MQNSKEKTLSQRIAERIIKYILDENLQPGDKLPNETVMCERLNVGRSSLREAMDKIASGWRLDSIACFVSNGNLSIILSK